MKKIKTILTNTETEFLKREKKSIIEGFNKLRRFNLEMPKDEYKRWLTWRLIELIEMVDRRSCQDINVVRKLEKTK